MKPLTCVATRRRLQAYHDAELAVPDQIAVSAHLDWCDDCAAILCDMQDLGVALRRVHPGRAAAGPAVPASFSVSIVNRLKAERTMSWPVRFQRLFEDAHLVYAGAAGASAALVCVLVMLGMMRFATSTPSPNSLAALVDLLTPGSNQNPVVPRASVQMPRPIDPAFAGREAAAGDDDAVFTLSAVVTREGRVANLELLREPGDHVVPGSVEAKAVADLLDAVSRARFEPGSVAGLPVAVNMVWLFAHTTVRGTPAPAPPPAQPKGKKRDIAAPGAPGPGRLARA